MTTNYGGYDELAWMAELYDPSYDGRKDIDFFVDYSQQAKGRTLELGCGTGRVLIPTAAAGCEITGLDLSPFMLAKCREKLSVQPAEVQRRVTLVQDNMTDFATGEQYNLVTVPFRPFQHLITVEEQKACLYCVYRHLKPGGWLILDLFHTYPPATYDPKYWAEKEDKSNIKLPGGVVMRRTTRIADFHRDLQYNDIEIVYYLSQPDGRTERLVQAFPFRYFFRYEVEHLLTRCGFEVAGLFGNFDRSPFSNDSPEMIFVAKKMV